MCFKRGAQTGTSFAGLDGPLPDEIQSLQSVEVIDVLDLRSTFDPEPGQSVEEDRQDGVELEPCKRRADAEVDTRSE